jgi:PKD repeat protein
VVFRKGWSIRLQDDEMPLRICRDVKVILVVSIGLALIADRPVKAVGQEASSAVQSYREPTAFAGADEVVVVGEAVEFFGQGVSADDEIVEYAWDFESDGVQDFVSAQTGYATHRFSREGDYQCVLTVKDSFGRFARDSRRIIAVAEKVDSLTAQQMLHPARPTVDNPGDGVVDRYAMIINGGSESRYWVDVELAYDMLTNGYGFSPSDVYLLNYRGTNPDGNNPNDMIDYSATHANLQTVFSEIASRADDDDEVFICITDHGRGYSGPLSEGGGHLGYLDGRASIDPGDEEDFLESNFQLRSLFTGGNYRCNHGMGMWKVRKKYYTGSRCHYYRNKYVSTLDNVYIEELGTTVSDSDIYIERLMDYALGDTDGDGFIDTG